MQALPYFSWYKYHPIPHSSPSQSLSPCISLLRQQEHFSPLSHGGQSKRNCMWMHSTFVPRKRSLSTNITPPNAAYLPEMIKHDQLVLRLKRSYSATIQLVYISVIQTVAFCVLLILKCAVENEQRKGDFKPCLMSRPLDRRQPICYLQVVSELNSGPFMTNKSSGQNGDRTLIVRLQI